MCHCSLRTFIRVCFHFANCWWSTKFSPILSIAMFSKLLLSLSIFHLSPLLFLQFNAITSPVYLLSSIQLFKFAPLLDSETASCFWPYRSPATSANSTLSCLFCKEFLKNYWNLLNLITSTRIGALSRFRSFFTSSLFLQL